MCIPLLGLTPLNIMQMCITKSALDCAMLTSGRAVPGSSAESSGGTWALPTHMNQVPLKCICVNIKLVLIDPNAVLNFKVLNKRTSNSINAILLGIYVKKSF